jgi:16S rRNA (adenine1518-N6/adenine1519-N6)-dimethyltransferase
MKIIPKKSLGQNFLKDDTVLQRIIKSANLSTEDTVIEIGPGKGVLTEKLAAVCKKVLAIELDERLIEVLYTKFAGNQKIEIIQGDILKINLPELVKKELKANEAKSYKLVANIPYYITAPIIRLLLETQYPPAEIILMVQKEVAERICAQAGKMSLLAVAVQYYAQPEYLFAVPATAFVPAPKVDSAVIRITNYESRIMNGKEDIKKFFRIVRAGFSAKRKTLANNLSNSLKIDKNIIEKTLIKIGFSKNTRAQELGVEDWKELVKKL